MKDTPTIPAGSALETVATAHGSISLNPTTDAKMAHSFARGIYPNESLILFARRVTDSSSVVLDIGAHIGTFAIPMAASGRSVIAFEPAPATHAILRRNIEQNSAQVDVRTVGLSRAPGKAAVEIRKTGNAGANSLVPGDDIVVSTLDAEVDATDFIKIDVEGMEMEVLEGGTALIERSHPIVFCEVNLSQLRAHNTAPVFLEAFFTERNYRLYYLLENGANGGVLARVNSLSLLTACIAPRAWLLGGESAPFDIIAIPVGKTVPYTVVGFGVALKRLVKHNLHIKIERIKKIRV